MPYYTRYNRPEGAEPLKVRVLRALQEGPKTTQELYRLFPEYKSPSVHKAMNELLHAGYDIRKGPIGKTKSGFTYYRYTLHTKDSL